MSTAAQSAPSTEVADHLLTSPIGESTPRRARRAVALGAGNALEWFDWGVYGAMLPFFSTYVFGGDDTGAVLKGLAVFAAGFVARPVGGLVFGIVADRYSRTTSLILTIACVAGGCLGIAFLPSHQVAGAGAGLMLLLLRVLQGLGQGGELPSLQVYITETAPRRRLGLWSSVIYTSGNVGVIAGMALGAGMATVLDATDIRDWGWRIPFLIGGGLGLCAIALRRSLSAPEESSRPRLDVSELLRAVVARRRRLVAVALLVAGTNVAIYAWGNSASTFAITFGHMSQRSALWAAVAAYATAATLIPVWGHIADRTSFRGVMLAGTAVVVAGSIPVNQLLSGSATNLYLCMIAMLIPINAILAVEPVCIALLVPAAARTTGIGITYSTVAALLGGTAPYVRSWLHIHVGDLAFSGYVTALAATSLICLWVVSPARPSATTTP